METVKKSLIALAYLNTLQNDLVFGDFAKGIIKLIDENYKTLEEEITRRINDEKINSISA